MIRTKSLFIVFVLIFTLVVSGCSSESVGNPLDDFAKPDQHESSKTLIGNHFDLLQKATDELLKGEKLEAITPTDLYQKVVLNQDSNYFVVDIRDAASFAKGNIEGAVNIPYALTANPNLLASLPKDKKIVVVCFSGHTAGQTAAFWKLLGYDAVPMLNGMGGWKTGTGSALPKAAFNYPVTTSVPEAKTYDLPTLNVKDVTSIESLIINRSQNYLASGKGAVVKPAGINTETSNYYLVDIRSAKDFNKGHAKGAINIPYQTIASKENLKKLPTNQKIVLIGYTGTDASEVQRLLNQLGYDTYAMFQGMRVWTSNEEINGIAPVSTEVVPEFPVKPLDFDINDTGGGSASCG